MREDRYLVAGCSLLMAFALFAAADDDPTIDDKPLSQWVKQLRSENRGFQMRAAQTLSSASNLQARIIPLVLPVLKSERENDKFVAAQVLGVYGPMSRAAIPDLLPMLKGTQYERNRAAAAKALGQILKDAKSEKEIDEVTAALIEAFKDPYPDVRREAVAACGMIGPAARACIPKLTPLLNEQNGYHANLVATTTAWTCERMGPLAKEHVDLLITLMHRVGPASGDPGASAYVAALGAIGPVHENVAPNILDNMEQYTRWSQASWHVLQKFGPQAEQAIPFTRRFLTKPRLYGGSEQNGAILIEAMKFLQVAGPKAVDALPEVEALTKYKEEYVDYSSIHKEAAKTAGILKGLAAGNTEKAAPGGKE